MPNFATVGEEVTYLVTHIARAFMGGFSGSGENGIDVSFPVGTPIYAVEGGTVVGSGYYQGGGVVSIESAPGRIWYYQHLDQDSLSQGQKVGAGALVGLSGGQNSGGHHPANPNFSSWPHLEIGVNAPWGGIWGNPSGKGNVNPVPDLVKAGAANGGVKTGGSGSPGGVFPSGGSPSGGPSGLGSPTGGIGGLLGFPDPSTWIPGIINSITQMLGLNGFSDLLWRAGFIIAGLILVFLGIQIMFIKQEAEIAGTFTGAAVKGAAAGA